MSEFEQFVNSQIAQLIDQERSQNADIEKERELQIAIDFCKNFLRVKDEQKQRGNVDEKQLVEESEHETEERHREEVLAKLIELKLDLEQYKVDFLLISFKSVFYMIKLLTKNLNQVSDVLYVHFYKETVKRY